MHGRRHAGWFHFSESNSISQLSLYERAAICGWVSQLLLSSLLSCFLNNKILSSSSLQMIAGIMPLWHGVLLRYARRSRRPFTRYIHFSGWFWQVYLGWPTLKKIAGALPLSIFYNNLITSDIPTFILTSNISHSSIVLMLHVLVLWMIKVCISQW